MARKRDSLIKAGERLFTRYGVRKVLVQEICTEADVEERTFYAHFQDLNDLARAVVREWMKDAVKRFEAIELAATPFTEKVELICALAAEITARPGRVFVEDIIRLKIDMSEITTRTIRFLEQAQKRGELRRDMPPEALHAALTALDRLHHDPMLRQLYREPRLLTRDMFNLFYEGALRRGG